MPSEIIRDAEIALAEQHVERGDIPAAIQHYFRLLDDNPDDVTSLNRVGDLYVRIGDEESAATIFERVAEHWTRDEFFLKALAAYKKVNKLAPARLHIYEALGDLYERMELYEEAAEQLSVLAAYFTKHGESAHADRLAVKVDRARRKFKPPATDDSAAANRPLPNPVAGLAIAGVPVVRTSADMLIFLCHASEDKVSVRRLYEQLTADGYLPWLDEEDLLPGQKWEHEITKAVRRSHVVIICLSSRSITKAGFLQKEIRIALDVLNEQPDGIIFVVPARLERCDVPDPLRHLHYVDLFEDRGYVRLRRALDSRVQQLGFVTR